MRRLLAWVAAAVLLALGVGGVSAGIEEIDYARYDARVTDSKGVSTDLKDFGYATGANILMAIRGEADVEIPFRLIRTIDIGAYVPEERRSPCTVTLRTGRTVALEVDAVEGDRLLRGKAEFGEFRIRMGRVRRLELVALSHLTPE
ncbi:MAG: hypothetical protein IT460_07680 [Planctomycetes bacterium]|nr:hypothetical protein [Planctomycetota bacterium]